MIIGETLGIFSDNKITGHRFHHNGLVTINHANDYQASLKKAFVIADYDERQQLIFEQINKAAASINGKAN